MPYLLVCKLRGLFVKYWLQWLYDAPAGTCQLASLQQVTMFWVGLVLMVMGLLHKMAKLRRCQARLPD